MAKEIKTNAMRILDREKISYKVNLYECDEFIDGISIADMLGQEYERSYKTLVLRGKSGANYVCVIQIHREIDLKAAAREFREKSVEMIHVKELLGLTGYIRGGCTSIGMKKQFRTIIDITAQEQDEIIISGGRIGAQILLSPVDLCKVTRGVFADIQMK